MGLRGGRVRECVILIDVAHVPSTLTSTVWVPVSSEPCLKDVLFEVLDSYKSDG